MIRPPSRLLATLIRAGALLAIGVILLGTPWAVVHLVGLPQPGSWSFAAAGRLDDRVIAEIGAGVFLLLWAWFVLTVAAEVTRVGRALTDRRRQRRDHTTRTAATLAPLPSTPAGWIRRLVRLALISSVAVTASSGTRWLGAAAAAPDTARVAWHLPDATVSLRSAATASSTDGQSSSSLAADTAPSTLVADGRSTPYSLAVALGDPTLREQIIALNLGGPVPGGNTWTGGVFPEGMLVVVPDGAAAQAATVGEGWTVHEVLAGDSVYGIVESMCDDNLACVGDTVDAVLDQNLGDTMIDGRVFDDPSLIVVGWSLDIPTMVAETPADERVEPADAIPATGATSVPATAAPATAEPATVPTAAAPTAVPATVPAAAAPATVPTAAAPAAVPTTTTRPATTTASSSTASPGDAAPVVVPTATPTRAPISTSLGAAVLLCAGALGLIESRRRHQLRRSTAGTEPVAPSPQSVTTERLLRALDATERAVRLDVVLRFVGGHLVGSGHHVLGLLCDEHGAVTVLLDRPARCQAPAEMAPLDDSRWRLDAAVTTAELSQRARLAGQPCPALVHLGSAAEQRTGAPAGELFIDLEAFGLVCVDGHPADVEPVITALAASLAVSPVGETVRVITHGLDPSVHLGNLAAESAASFDDALDRAAVTLGSTPTVSGGRRTFELRARGTGGEAWEPVVVLARLTAPADDELAAVARRGGSGLAVVVDRVIPDAGLTMRATPTGWQLDALGLSVVAAGLDAEQLHAVHDLLDAAERPLPVAPRPVAPRPVAHLPAAHLPIAAPGAPQPSDTTGASADPFHEPSWALMVRLLGQIGVVTCTGEPVSFDRGKSLELVAWLSLHRDRPTRSGARAALWEIDVRDNTFANIVSDARRTLARAVAPADGEEWIERTLTDHLPLHPLVVTDAQLLRARLSAARCLGPAEAIEVLRPGVAAIGDLPFAGTDYLWPDAEGSTSELTLLATAAATELAQHHLAVGDIDGVFWATGQGLRVLSGHEELIALRMRAFALRGDLAGVRHEWEIYERSLHADSWSLGEPSPKLVAIRRELLSR
jgi:hypothetical protein